MDHYHPVDVVYGTYAHVADTIGKSVGITKDRYRTGGGKPFHYVQKNTVGEFVDVLLVRVRVLRCVCACVSVCESVYVCEGRPCGNRRKIKRILPPSAKLTLRCVAVG